jgi:hypothetical protein
MMALRQSVPNVTAKNCRILIEPVGNIYYAVNSTAFAIGYSVESTCYLYIRSSFVIPEQVAIRLELLLFRLL